MRTASETIPPLIDVHHHAIPAVYLDALAQRGVHAPVQGASFPTWSPDASLAMMDDAGIAAAVLSVSSPGLAGATGDEATRLSRAVNEYFAGIIAEHPDRFGAFALIPAHDPQAAVQEVAYALDQLGLDGVGLYTSVDGVYLGDPLFEPIMADLCSRGVPAFVHPVLPPDLPPMFGAPGSVAEFPLETTRAIMSLLFSGTLDSHQDLRLIVSHAGGTIPFLAPRIQHAAVIDPGLEGRPPEDLAASLGRLYYDVAMSATKPQLSCLLEVAAPDHVLFGSDFPFMPAAHGLDNAAGLRSFDGLEGEALSSVAYGNARSLLPRLVGAAGLRVPAAQQPL